MTFMATKSLAGTQGMGNAGKTFPDAKGGVPQLEDVARLIKDGKVKNVVIMVRRDGRALRSTALDRS